METIKNYETSDIGASQSLVTLEGFIGDMDNAELADDSTVDTSDAVTAINGLIFALEQRDAKIERLRAGLLEILSSDDVLDDDVQELERVKRIARRAIDRGTHDQSRPGESGDA